ncbi:AAA family ATPase [Pyrobaculum calidifontis]|uniref:ATPase associated with various cellular activities, AAA_5 n=1 Tax=Pyrobaculum calidifontis (strain DSM 21063 / JCM 11548 / VA1) TaxID=410359 RepID=A3MXA8_PYRCJ|nr:AAA family ATPase [Pyrobaculum calidifontis]ABO09275.1 ATPase associated with various cellular activities, AAA_5 [Pyrobaculum calidifontis JCM 11548]
MDCGRFFVEVTRDEAHVGRFLWSPVGERWRVMEAVRRGDCVIHYIATRSKSRRRGSFVGVSRVASEAKVVDREELLRRGVESEYLSEWGDYDQFYLVELEGFVEFPRPILLDEAKNFGVEVQQAYLYEVDVKVGRRLVEVGLRGGAPVQRRGFVDERVKRFVALALVAGKNLLFVGAPGVGKTRLALDSAKLFTGCEPVVEVGRDGLTYDDLVLHFVASGSGARPRLGSFAKAVVESWRSIREGRGPCQFVFDEINRANVDLALGRVFTALDLAHRDKVPVLELDEELARPLGVEPGVYYLPFSFRVFATMNVVDRAQLFKLSFALMRRFAYVYVAPPHEKYASEVRVEELRDDFDLDPYVEVALEELSIEPRGGDIPALIRIGLPTVGELREFARGLGVSRVLSWVVEVGEKLGVEVGPSLAVDMLKLAAVYMVFRDKAPRLFDNPGEFSQHDFLDLATASLAVPYLSMALPKIRQRYLLSQEVKELETLKNIYSKVGELFGEQSFTARLFRGLFDELPIDLG